MNDTTRYANLMGHAEKLEADSLRRKAILRHCQDHGAPFSLANKLCVDGCSCEDAAACVDAYAADGTVTYDGVQFDKPQSGEE